MGPVRVSIGSSCRDRSACWGGGQRTTSLMTDLARGPRENAQRVFPPARGIGDNVKGWDLVYDGFDRADEGLREALCTLGNGFFATRGAWPESRADGIHYPGTYIAGCYNRLTTEVAGHRVENEEIVNAPNWLPLSFRIGDGPWLGGVDFDTLESHQMLDLRRGVLDRWLRVRDAQGHETVIRQRRFVHMDDRHLAGLSVAITAENWSGPITLRSGIDGDVANAGVARYSGLRGDHLVPVEAVETEPDTLLLEVRTRQSGIVIALAARTRLRSGMAQMERERSTERAGTAISHIVDVGHLEQGQPLMVEKIVALHTSRDSAISAPGEEAVGRVRRAAEFDALIARHELAWDRLWRLFDIELEDSDDAQLILRLHVFHVLQTLSPNTYGLDAGVPARGLHGEAYRGHVFWDELFILPFLSMRLPRLSRWLLEYRFRRLDAARAAAAAEGHRGATFPWQSGSSGREESQVLHLNPKSGRWLPDNSWLQKHINVAVAFNLWHYVQVTGDRDFLRSRAGPILLELARYWASVCEADGTDGRFHIRGVMGPDEYHDAYPDADRPGLDDNAYTNVMVAWTLARSREVLDALAPYERQELIELLQVTPDELAHWDEMTRRLAVPFHGDRIISQFAGYGELEEFDWVGYAERYGDIQRLDRILEAEGDSTNRYKVSKQADVLMLFYLLPPDELVRLFGRLGYRLDPSVDLPRTIDYYLRRTSHGSTLSRIVHAWVLARFDRPRSWDLFTQSLESDIADVQRGSTAEGIHLAAMAGTADLVQRCYAGVEVRPDYLSVRPALPEALAGMNFTIDYLGQRIHISVRPDGVALYAPPGGRTPIRLTIDGAAALLLPGQRLARAIDLRRSPATASEVRV
jgi:trehalose/maltose hydrolase-like predicted phosphorylase